MYTHAGRRALKPNLDFLKICIALRFVPSSFQLGVPILPLTREARMPYSDLRVRHARGPFVQPDSALSPRVFMASASLGPLEFCTEDEFTSLLIDLGVELDATASYADRVVVRGLRRTCEPGSFDEYHVSGVDDAFPAVIVDRTPPAKEAVERVPVDPDDFLADMEAERRPKRSKVASVISPGAAEGAVEQDDGGAGALDCDNLLVHLRGIFGVECRACCRASGRARAGHKGRRPARGAAAGRSSNP